MVNEASLWLATFMHSSVTYESRKERHYQFHMTVGNVTKSLHEYIENTNGKSPTDNISSIWG
jgi:hypothetical protein